MLFHPGDGSPAARLAASAVAPTRRERRGGTSFSLRLCPGSAMASVEVSASPTDTSPVSFPSVAAVRGLWLRGCAGSWALLPCLAMGEGRSQRCWSCLCCLHTRDKEFTPGSKELIGPPAGLQPKSIKSVCGSRLTAIGFCVQALARLYTGSNATRGLGQSLAPFAPVTN